MPEPQKSSVCWLSRLGIPIRAREAIGVLVNLTMWLAGSWTPESKDDFLTLRTD